MNNSDVYMKDSGIQWIGNIPYSWSIVNVKSLTSGDSNDIVDGPFGSDMKVSDYVDDGVPLIQLNNIKELKHSMDRFRFITEDKADELSRHNAFPGDVVVAKMMPAGRSMIASDAFSRYALSSDSIRIKVSNMHSNRFLCYCFNAYLTNMYEATSTGSTRLRINTGDVRKSSVALPSTLEEELSVSHYLDTQCNLIDSEIEALRKIVENLDELKLSTIYYIITKGLDATAEKSESNVPWIGEVPSAWDLRPVKSLFEIRKRIASTLGYDVLSITQKGIRVKDIVSNEGQQSNDYSKYQIVKPGDFAMNHMDLLTGFIDLSKVEGVTSPDYRVFTPVSDDMDPQYALYIFQTAYRCKIFYGLGQGVSTLGRWRLPKEQFLNFMVPVPSIQEQKGIVNYLTDFCKTVDGLIDKYSEKLDDLLHFKESLIYEYVTGKKQVPKEVLV